MYGALALVAEEDASKMKIAVPSTGKDLSSEIHDSFGRCPYFLIVNVNDKKIDGFEVIENTELMSSGGVGISTAQIIVNAGTDFVIYSKIGPRAIDILSQSGVETFIGNGIVKEVINKFIDNKLEKTK